MLGIGIGHPEATSDYRRPLTTMRTFLDDLDASPTPPPVDGRCLAALGPKMLDLAGERTAGTHPYFVPVEHTRFARERLGPGKLVAPELACVVETDPVRARAVARGYAKLYLGLRNYTQNLLDHGFTEDDLADGGSDRLIDAVIPHGSAEQIAEVVRAHLDAGADHVCLQPLGEEGIPEEVLDEARPGADRVSAVGQPAARAPVTPTTIGRTVTRAMPVLVGRVDEQAQLEAMLEAARRGDSGGLVIRGEPGVGKSSLLEAAGRAGGRLPGVASAGGGVGVRSRVLGPAGAGAAGDRSRPAAARGAAAGTRECAGAWRRRGGGAVRGVRRDAGTAGVGGGGAAAAVRRG